jgi:hypothetical protein
VTSVVTAGGISVTIRGAVVDQGETVLDRLVSDGVPGSLVSRNAKLWGPDAAPLAARRLGWLGLPETSRFLRDRLAGPVGEARDAGLDRIVLVASGGAALAAEALRELQPEEAELGAAAVEIARELFRPLPLVDARRDLGGDEPLDGLPQLLVLGAERRQHRPRAGVFDD